MYGTQNNMLNKSRYLGMFAVVCILLLISSVTAVPYKASESTKDLLDAEELAKSVMVDITPRVGANGETTFGVALSSTDARYSALNGKTFEVNPKKTDGGVDFAVGSTDGGIAGLLSGKSAHIPRTLDGAPITDPVVFDSDAFDRMAQTEMTGIFADRPIRKARGFDYSDLAMSAGDDSAGAGTTCRQAVADLMFAAPRGRDSGPVSMLAATSLNAADGSAFMLPKVSDTWWQWTKEKCKNAWSTTKVFVKEHWRAILITIIVIIIVLVIIAILISIFGPAAAPVISHEAAFMSDPELTLFFTCLADASRAGYI
jgi:hypothetical protein